MQMFTRPPERTRTLTTERDRRAGSGERRSFRVRPHPEPRLARPALVAGALLLGALHVLPSPTLAQDADDEPGWVLGADDVGIGIGDVPRLTGIRLNYRDRALERVTGINVTIWAPHEEMDGRVAGLALGVPVTGAGTLEGVGIGAGVGVVNDFRGLGVAPLGMGAGGDLVGIHLGGIGMGAGGELRGLAVGGVGMGVGGDARGIVVGGVGMGVGADFTGLAVGGLGGGIGGSMTGIFAGGLGAGIGEDARGVVLAGLGAGVGGDLRGLAVGGLGFGVGGELRGVAVSGLGVGANRIRGIVLSGIGAGSPDATGGFVAPAFFIVGSEELEGEFRGVSISAYNRIRGRQRGLAIGLLNIAQELHGVQIGLVNIAWNKESFPVLPLVNWSR